MVLPYRRRRLQESRAAPAPWPRRPGPPGPHPAGGATHPPPLEVNDEEEADDEDEGAPMQRTPSGNDVLQRQNSGGMLQRQNSRDNVNRFDSMVSWENSDHPVAVWKLHFGGMGGVDGCDILSMNPAFVQQYMNDNLRHILRGHDIQFDRDWTKLTNEQAIDLLCHAMGRSREARPRLTAGYVVTVDNLLKMLSVALRMRCGLPRTPERYNRLERLLSILE